MKLIVGLGNPGTQYALNRHNVGFMIIDTLAHIYSYPTFKRYNQSLIAEGVIGGQRALVLKPLTYMNISGQAVGDVVRFYKIPLDDIIIIHDDIDLSFGDMRVKKGGGHGGHNGLKSIDTAIGKEYWRLRIGVGHPGHKDAVSPYVLSNFSKQELDELVITMRIVVDEMSLLLKYQTEQFLKNIKSI